MEYFNDNDSITVIKTPALGPTELFNKKIREGGKMAKCKSCGAKINFVTLPSGRKCPIETEQKKLYVLESGDWILHNGFEPHFANCPSADYHRKPKITKQEIGPLTKREGGS